MTNERYAAVADLMGYDHGEHIASMARLTPRMARAITTEGLRVGCGSCKPITWPRLRGKDGCTDAAERRALLTRAYGLIQRYVDVE